MSQTNYFAYNIIDTLYFNNPEGHNLTTVYGVDENFKRRSFYDSIPSDQQAEYDAKEKEFIQAVINKYIMDDFGNGSYFDVFNVGSVSNNEYSNVTAYFKDKSEIGIELGDMISNVNGTHNYKLMSAKDIDFDNVILPNSKIEDDFNWGSFDKTRRWGNKPIRINNTFELLNVIDYLLCACNNLWDELYRIKYNSSEYVQIWFTKDCTNPLYIRYTNRLKPSNFQLNGGESDYVTYLNPCDYYTFINNKTSDNNFGFVTNFKTIGGESAADYNYDRKISDNTNRNIILMNIEPRSRNFRQNKGADDKQNINGNLQDIAAYRLGNELKIYPGSRISAFIDSNNIYYDSNKLVDFTNKKLTNEVFFKTSQEPGNDVFSKVYIKFLDTDTMRIRMAISSTEVNFVDPYFLYYISKDEQGNEIKNIIGCNYRTSSLSNNYISQLKTAIKNYIYDIIQSNNDTEYNPRYNYKYDVLISPDNYDVTQIDKTNDVPVLYVVPNEFISTLEISTPNSTKYAASSDSIVIYYYKNNNSLKCNVSRKDNDNISYIKPIYDRTQSNNITYHDHRYNIPTDETIYFKFDATYVALDSTEEGNPLKLKLDDEYDDIIYYYDDNILNNIPDNEQYTSYYKLNGIDEYGHRVFEQLKNNEIKNNTEYHISVTNNSRIDNYKHMWVKKENPYKINVKIENDELIIQNTSKEKINQEISNIISNNELTQISYNEYTFSHTLPNDIEQIKLNFIFSIDETSKVNEISYVMPVNINKVYKPTINYYSHNALMLEKNNYSNVLLTINNYTGDTSRPNTITLSSMYDYMFNKYGESGNNVKLDKIKNIYTYISDNGEDINSLTDLTNKQSYDNTVNNTIFEFSYDPKLDFIDLIGTWYTEQYITSLTTRVTNNPLYNHGFAYTQIIKRDQNSNIIDSFILKDRDNSGSVTAPYIFNINGLGLNYRLHGANGLVDNVFKNIYSAGGLEYNNIRKYYSQYDLLSVATPNNNSINKELQIKIHDGDENSSYYQLSYINIDSSYGWQNNNLEFNSGININDNNTYIINTVPVSIHKESYLVNCDIIGAGSTTISYYVPMAYMQINSSTVYPPITYAPTAYNYDLNNSSDSARYRNYVEWWNTGGVVDSDDYYKPITLSLKLSDNIDIPNPYYYESNEAVIKFNIKRALSSYRIPITGLEKIIYVALNSRYYLSDFVNVGNIETNNIPTGSYMYYNTTYHMYMINEIYNNSWKRTIDPNTNDVINHYTYSNISGLSNPDINGISNAKVPYPIFRKHSINNQNEWEYNDNNKYNYNIYRISDINKAKIDDILIRIVKPSGSGYETVSNSGTGIETNKNYSYIDFTNNFKDNFALNNNSFNLIQYGFSIQNIYSSKNYVGTTANTEGANTIIAPIIREKPNYTDLILKMNTFINSRNPNDNINLNETDLINTGLKNMYLSKEYTHNDETKIYEFFEFSYNNVCKITFNLDNNGNIISGEVTQLIPNCDLGESDAFNNQLNTFLLGLYKYDNDSKISFICSLDFYNMYLKDILTINNSSIIING